MDSNKYRRVQKALLELDDTARNELSAEYYKVIREKVIEPINLFLYHLHLAYEEGRNDSKQEKPSTRGTKRAKKSTTLIPYDPSKAKPITITKGAL